MTKEQIGILRGRLLDSVEILNQESGIPDFVFEDYRRMEEFLFLLEPSDA